MAVPVRAVAEPHAATFSRGALERAAAASRTAAVTLVAVLTVACGTGGAPSAAEDTPPQAGTLDVAPAGPTETFPPLDTPPPPDRPRPTVTPTLPRPSTTTGACDDPLGCYGAPRRVGAFDAEVVPGASGLAASRRNPGVLYLLDDRPGTRAVWVIGTDGTMVGAITVDGLDARDTESLAVGPCGPDDPAPCVYVADIGDNLRSRADIAVHRFTEPDVADGVPERVAADVARWTYPNGPHDAEALVVDDAGAAFIVTKAPFDPETGETGEARLYRAATFSDGVLEDLGVLPVPRPHEPLHSLVVGNVVTGGDHRDGRVLLRTYDQVLLYVASEQGADLTTLADWDVRALPSPFEHQSEAIAWEHEGCGYFTAGEIAGDLWHVPCTPGS